MSNQSVVHCSCYSAEEIQVGLPEGSAEAVRRVPSRARTGGGERHSSQLNAMLNVIVGAIQTIVY